jgi:lambda family phage portal protein
MLNARVRQMCRDNPLASSIKRSYSRNVIGRGIRPSASAKTSGGRLRKKFNKGMNEVFNRWANNPMWCDAEGRKTFWQFQSQAMESLVEVGEYIVIKSVADNGPGQIPLRLQAVEPEQLDIVRLKNVENGNEIRGGVEIDTFGRAVAYHILEKNTLVFSRARPRSVRVPADRVIHLFRQDRAGQTRGVTWFAPIIRKLRDLSEYDATELSVARLQSCFGVGFERPAENVGQGQIGLNPAAGETTTDIDGNRKVNIKPNMVVETNPGEKMHFFQPNRPGNMYSPFTKAQIGLIAAGIGLCYEQVARDFKGGNFSAQRQALLEDRREWHGPQEMIILILCDPVWNIATELAVLSGIVPAPTFSQRKQEFCRCDWQPDGWEWIDPAKQAIAIKILLDLKLETRRRILKSMNLNVEDVAESRSEEKELYHGKGILLPDEKEGPPDDGTGNESSDEPARGFNQTDKEGQDASKYYAGLLGLSKDTLGQLLASLDSDDDTAPTQMDGVAA